ncbi:hypothetical protein ABKV19_022380 [Rosa sericea]
MKLVADFIRATDLQLSCSFSSSFSFFRKQGFLNRKCDVGLLGCCKQVSRARGSNDSRQRLLYPFVHINISRSVSVL